MRASTEIIAVEVASKLLGCAFNYIHCNNLTLLTLPRIALTISGTTLQTWSLCIICQEDIQEALSPGLSRGDKGVAYKSFLEIVS